MTCFFKTRCVLASVLLLVASACPVEQLFPEPVAMGVGRLSVRAAAVALSLIVDDETCGFASAQVKAAARFEGEVGRPGILTLTVDHCVLDLDSLHVVSSDCEGVNMLAGGKVTVSGTQKISGQLTGNPEQPLIPLSADAVEMQLEMRFLDFETRSSDADNALRIDSGRLSLLAHPHLAASASLGVCAVATRDLSVDSLRFDDARLWVQSEDSRFEVPVPSSDISAQVGRWQDRENDLRGFVTVWDKRVDVPVAGDSDGLDPEYRRADFEKAMACTEDLAQPLSYVCKSLEGDVALGLARLISAAYGILADHFDDDTVCGFASDAVIDGQQVSGEVGRPGGRVRLEIRSPCTKTFAAGTVIKQNCNGVLYLVSGTVSASGSKEIVGWNTGSRDPPIIPDSLQPSDVGLLFTFSDFSIERSDLPYRLQIRNGELDGRVSVQVAQDTALHACALKSSAASFRGIDLSQADVLLTVDGNRFARRVDSSDLDAVNGHVGDHENALQGSLSLDGIRYAVGDAGGPVPLDPNYDAARFIQDDACRPNYLHAAEARDCSLYPLIGNIAARLLVHSTGALASMINADSSCGFEDTWGVLVWPSEVVGDPGDMGSITWDVEACTVGSPDPQVIKEDCFGSTTATSGSALVNATRTVQGERNTQFLVVDSVIPRDPQAVSIELREVELRDFASFDLAPGAGEPEQKVIWSKGFLSAVVHPFTGQNQKDAGAYDIPTPLAAFADLSVVQARATLFVEGLTFVIDVASADLQAQNGVYLGQGNNISGRMTVDGVEVNVEPAPLDPEYEQGAFDESYACTLDLVETLPFAPR